jgi:hypothetical protein
MTQTQITSGKLHRATAQGRGPPAVRLVTANGVAMDRRRVPTAPNRASGWIVQVVIVATSAFAFLDLYLLLTSGHH